VAEWRLGRGWSEGEIAERLAELHALRTSFDENEADMTPERGWNRYFSESILAREPPGEPVLDGPFRRAELATASYQFSDPAIVIGHFDAQSALLERRILLEMKAASFLRYLGGVVVQAVRSDATPQAYTFAFRYDTLSGHIERGWEWFTLTKRRASGEIQFRIEAAWLPGEFPNFWSRLGFHWLGPRYQERWHRAAHGRLFRIAHGGMTASPAVDAHAIAHTGPDVVFGRTPRVRTLPVPPLERETKVAARCDV